MRVITPPPESFPPRRTCCMRTPVRRENITMTGNIMVPAPKEVQRSYPCRDNGIRVLHRVVPESCSRCRSIGDGIAGIQGRSRPAGSAVAASVAMSRPWPDRFSVGTRPSQMSRRRNESAPAAATAVEVLFRRSRYHMHRRQASPSSHRCRWCLGGGACMYYYRDGGVRRA